MSVPSRPMVRSLLSLAGFSLLPLMVACGAPPSGPEQVGEGESAISCPRCGWGVVSIPTSPLQGYRLPVYIDCSLIGGTDSLGLSGNKTWLTPGGSISSNDPSLQQAQTELVALGAGVYELHAESGGPRPGPVTYYEYSWQAVDMTLQPASAVLPIVNEYASVPSVEAGYYSCPLPGTTSTVLFAVYGGSKTLNGGNPTGCSSCATDI